MARIATVAKMRKKLPRFLGAVIRLFLRAKCDDQHDNTSDRTNDRHDEIIDDDPDEAGGCHTNHDSRRDPAS